MADEQDEYAINVKGVSKHFGKVHALDNVDLTAVRGKVTGLLGPNGAGKSTLIKVMTTLLDPSSGSVVVDNVNVLKHPAQARKRIGLAGQFAAVDDFLTGRETLEMVARLYHLPRKEAKKRAIELLTRLDLSDAADRQTKTYSGGMRRRLDLGASLVATPSVLFLDEPTTGLDPRTRLQLWDIIRDLVSRGVTILLTTQYLEEADALADYMYVIDQGKMIAEGTAEQLKRSLGQDVIEFKIKDAYVVKAQKVLLDNMKREVEIDEGTRRLLLRTKNGSEDLLKAALYLRKAGIPTEELSVHGPSLDDVFLSITGKHTKEAENARV
ncbi:MAG TPA: ATP-binding cassette domain-containing protein [Candidatus Saccharimonadales bacterium]|nr:ATP-binding cassette domain-containing protein [Candidatus Saccharimonadales bacterium]